MAGIPAPIIIKRNRFDRVNNRISEMDEGEFWSIYTSYEQSLKYGTKDIFENICKAFDIAPDDFIFWYNFDIKERG